MVVTLPQRRNEVKKHAIRLLALLAAFWMALPAARSQTSTPPQLVTIVPQIVDGGAWVTTLALTNTTTSPTQVGLSFYQETGGGSTGPWSLSFAESTSAQGQPLVLPGGTTLFLHTVGAAGTTTVGWGMITEPYGSGTPAVSAYAVFTQRVPQQSDQEGTAEAGSTGSRFLVPFDNTNGAVTSIAIANPSAFNNSISVGVRSSAGTATQMAAITLPPGGHTSFALPTQFPVTTGQAGLAEFYGSSGGFSVLALRFSSGSLTTSPVYAANGAPIIIGSAN